MINDARGDNVAECIRIVAKCHDSSLACKRAPESLIDNPATAIRVRPRAGGAAIETMNHDNAVHVFQLG